MDEIMKTILGPEELIFNGKTSLIVDSTIEIINKHNFELTKLNSWFDAQKKDLAKCYALKYSGIIVNTEAELKKNVEKPK
jgi:hypothetical protein